MDLKTLLLAFFNLIPSHHSYEYHSASDVSSNPLVDIETVSRDSFKSFCEPYDRQTFKNENTVMLYRVFGRLGNKMLAYALLLAAKREYGFRSIMDPGPLYQLQTLCQNATQIQSLDDLCWQKYPFEKHTGLLQEVGEDPRWKKGRIFLYMDKVRLMGHNINEILRWDEILEKHEKEIRQNLYPNLKFQQAASEVLDSITTDHKQWLSSGKRIPKKFVYIGIHVRRTDSLKAFIEKYKLPELKPSYYLSAIDLYVNYFKSKKKLIFVVTSDDMKWVSDNLMPRVKSVKVYPVPSSKLDGEISSAATDLAVLASCNHTILSYGTFSFWSGFLAGGKRVIPKMVLRNNDPAKNPLLGKLSPFTFPDEGLPSNMYSIRAHKSDEFTIP